MTFEGQVTAGKGWHSGNMLQWSRLPFKPYPGTLNLRVGHKQVDELRALPGPKVLHKGVEFFWWPCTVAGVGAVVTWNFGCEPGVVEVVAPSRLRDLPLVDGQIVEVTV
jgi:CTP-dependent riboflavin kinase